MSCNCKNSGVAFISILLAAMAFFPVTGAHCQDRPNIVWIVSEDNTAGYMSMFDPHGAPTPHIEMLAAQGIKFTHAFSNAPVCSASRSTIITGCYGPHMASHYHRQIEKVKLPPSLKMFPFYLREAGYYTANNSKEDYNIQTTPGTWDESSVRATWKKRNAGQPFFYVRNIGITHESSMQFTAENRKTVKTITDQNTVFVQPNHPDTKLFRYTNALYRDKIMAMDREVGAIVRELEAEGLLDNTFIFYYGDNGGVLPGSKEYVKDEGVHVPMVVYIPSRYKNLSPLPVPVTTPGFVSFVDLAPTVLNLAGIPIPKEMDGKPFLGKGITATDLSTRNFTYSFADRMDEKYDMVRALRVGKFKYNRNYEPFHDDALRNNYRYKQLAYGEWDSLYQAKKLNVAQAQFFEPKPAEALYNIDEDPYEINNLATNPIYAKDLKRMRTKLDSMETALPDLSFFPEFYLIKNALADPLSFGQKHKTGIQKYNNIANLQLSDFKLVEMKLREHLGSLDPWERYWALIVCSGFGGKAGSLTPLAKQIALSDKELINKVRAAEFLAIAGVQEPAGVMLSALYQSNDVAEALLILNSITLMRSHNYHFKIPINIQKIDKSIVQHSMIQQRLMYLENMQPGAAEKLKEVAQ
jgi:arylsulfatase A-like enzyme